AGLKGCGGRLVEGLPELVVQASARDVVLQVDVEARGTPGWTTRRHAGATGERGPVAEVDIEELALGRPAVAQRVLEAAADGPAGTSIGLEHGVRYLSADDRKRAVDLRPRSA